MRYRENGQIDDEDLGPFILLAVAAISATTLGVQSVIRWWKVVELEVTSPNLNHTTVKTFRSLETCRIVGCISLCAIFSYRIADLDQPLARVDEWCFLIVLVYSALLTGAVLLLNNISNAIRSNLSNHVTSIHFMALLIMCYRTLVPLAFNTVDQSTPKEEEVIIRHTTPEWIEYISLFFTGFVIPLALPRITTESQESLSRETASLFSRAFYFYIDPVLWLSWKQSKVDIADLPALSDDARTKHLMNTIYPKLSFDLVSGKIQANLLMSLLSYFRHTFFFIFILHLVMVVNEFAAPIAILRILAYLESENREGLIRPWVWITWMIFGPIVSSVATHRQFYEMTSMGISTEVLLTELIFEHSLNTRLSASNDNTPSSNPEEETSTGTVEVSQQQAANINNLMTVDVSNCFRGTAIIQLPYFAIRLIICFAVLYAILGWSALVGCVVLFIALPIPHYLVKLRTRVQEERMRKADARLSTVSQAMQVLRMIKLFGWERHMESRIREQRNEELKYIYKNEILGSASHCVM